LNSDGNLTIWKVKAQAEIEHPFDMMTTRYDTRDWVKATVPGTVFGSYVLEGLELLNFCLSFHFPYRQISITIQ